MSGGGRMRWRRAAVIVVTSAVLAHVLSIMLVPTWVGHVAMTRASELAGGPNTLLRAPPISPQDRTIRRPSSNLLYSVCVIDTSNGPVEVQLAPTPGYASVSVYNGQLDNVLTQNNADAPEWPIRVRFGFGAQQTELSNHMASGRYIALLRHLRAASPELNIATTNTNKDVCRPVPAAP